VVNTTLAAPDAHARNYALLLHGDSVRLAPLYDLATSLAYSRAPRSPRALSMSISGTFDAREVTADHWLRFGSEHDLDGQSLVDFSRLVAQVAPEAAARALDELDDDWDGQVDAVRTHLLPALDRLGGA